MPSATGSNPYLKKGYQKYQFTLEEIAEIDRCIDDPLYFFENYYMLVTADAQAVPFKPFKFQKKILHTLLKKRFVCGVMSRQLGKSSIIIAFFLYLMLFFSNRKLLLLSRTEKSAIELLGRMKFAYEKIPQFMQQGIIRNDATRFSLENGSEIVVAATTPEAGRSGSYNCVFCDEFAFVRPSMANAFFGSAFPTISSGKETKFIILSTPNGFNKFHEIYSGAEKGANEFIPIKALWNERYDKKWAESQRKQLGDDLFSQEILCEFLGGENCLISSSYLQTVELEEPAIKKPYIGIWETPKIGHQYIVSSDVSEGVGKDYSVATVIDVTTTPYQVVAIWRDNHTNALEFPQHLMAVAQKYNEAFILIESGGGSINVGGQVATTIYYDYQYENVFCTSAKAGRGGKELTFAPGTHSILGLKMTKSVKTRGCANLKALIESDTLMFKAKEIIQEFSTFKKAPYGEGIYKAEEGCHDDIVMTLVSFAWLANMTDFQNMTETAYETQATYYDFIPTPIFPYDNKENYFVQDDKLWKLVGHGLEHLEETPILTKEDEELLRAAWLLK